MHILGLQGMPRRIYTYRDGLRLRLLEHGGDDRRVHHRRRRCSCSSSTSSSSRAAPAGATRSTGPDPWDARSLEWMIPSPTPEHNFDDDPDRHAPRRVLAPQVRRGRARAGRCASPTAEDVAQTGDATDVHLPSPSYWPLVLAVRPAAHRLRPDLQPRLCALVGGARRAGRHLRLGASSRPSTTTATPTTTTTTDDGPTATATPRRRRRRRAPSRRPRSRARRLTTRPSPTDAVGRRPTPAHDEPRADGHAHQHRASPTRSSAMWVFLGSECLLFGGLISTYLLYQSNRVGRRARSAARRSTTSRSRR